MHQHAHARNLPGLLEYHGPRARPVPFHAPGGDFPSGCDEEAERLLNQSLVEQLASLREDVALFQSLGKPHLARWAIRDMQEIEDVLNKRRTERNQGGL